MHRRSFTYLLGTQTMSNAADILYIMALVSLVFHETDSIFSSVLVPLLRMGAQMISGFLAPLILARFQLPFYFIRFSVRATGFLCCSAGPLVVSRHGADMGDCVYVGGSHVLSGRMDYACA